jgi:transcriptional repressor NrdR
VLRIERDLFMDADLEVSTHDIGDRTMRELQAIDAVAYVRFASVYREFETLDDFVDIVERSASPVVSAR